MKDIDLLTCTNINMKRVKLFLKQNDKCMELASTIESKLKENGFEIVDKDFDLGIAVGGDGTFLRMVNNSHFQEDAFYVGIHAGTLGFAQEISVEEIDDFIESLKTGDFYYEEVGIQESVIKTKEEERVMPSINEIVIRERDLNVIHLDVLVDGHLLESFAGDGLLISTSFGSTAYNRSCGGCIVENSLNTLQITPIAPTNNKNYQSLTSSILLSGDREIELIPTSKTKDCLLIIDGDNYPFEDVLSIKTKVDQKKVKIIRKKEYNFIQKVNEKLIQ